MSRSWDQARWAVEAENGGAIEVETSGGLTWTLRALVAAGAQGFRPVEEKQAHWSAMTSRLRVLGVPVALLPPDSSGCLGFSLGGTVQRVT